MSEFTVPIAKQVDKILRKKILSGHYIDGQLPSESQLASELGVSRATVRTVLVKFEAEGLIARKHGQGTFINTRVLDVDSNFHGIWDFHCMIEEIRRTPTVNTLSIEKRYPTQIEAEILDISEDVQIICFVRLFLADGNPVIYSTNLIPCKFFTGTNYHGLDIDIPIHTLLHRFFDQDISYSISDISSEIMPAFLKEYLLLKTGSPIIRLKDQYYNLSNQPILYGINYYNDKVMHLRIARSW